MQPMRSRSGRLFAAAAITASAFVIASPDPAGAAPDEGSVSGTVLDQGGQPLENVCVYLDGSNEASTDANGDFMIGGVPVGFHQVRYHDCRADPEYLDQWYEGHADQGSADPVEVLDQQDTALNTISMELGAGITGTITDDGASPLEDICVEAGLGTPEDHVASTRTAADGTYTLFDKLDLNVGVRYGRETAKSDIVLDFVIYDLLGPGLDYAAAGMATGKLTEDSFTPSASLTYRWSRYFSTYARYARGFRAGGFHVRYALMDGVVHSRQPSASGRSRGNSQASRYPSAVRSAGC